MSRAPRSTLDQMAGRTSAQPPNGAGGGGLVGVFQEALRRNAGKAVRSATSAAYSSRAEALRKAAKPSTPSPRQSNAYAEAQQAYGDLMGGLGVGGEYATTFGQSEDGKYAGFRTEGQLKAAILGRALDEYENVYGIADTIGTEAGRIESDATSKYNLGMADMWSEASQRMQDQPLRGENGQAAYAPGLSAPEARRFAEEKYDASGLTADHESTLGRVEKAKALAEMLESTRFSELAQTAGQRDYGVDPYLTKGWFGPEWDVKAFDRRRDADAVAGYGMTFDEMQSAQRRAESEASTDAEAQAEQMFDDDVFQRTGMNGRDLASATNLSPEQLLGVLDSEDFASLQGEVENALYPEDGSSPSPETVDEIRRSLATYDDTMWRVFEQMYGDALDPDMYAE